MTKASASKPRPRRAKRVATIAKGGSVQIKTLKNKLVTGRVAIAKGRVKAIMQAAAQSGLLSEKGGRIGGRVSSALIRQAKRQTGIETDTDLIEFALATVALEDNFAETFKSSRGKVDSTLKLGF
jgi:hypothetical protein